MSLHQVMYWIGMSVCVFGGIGVTLVFTAWAARQAFRNIRILGNSWQMFIRLREQDLSAERDVQFRVFDEIFDWLEARDDKPISKDDLYMALLEMRPD